MLIKFIEMGQWTTINLSINDKECMILHTAVLDRCGIIDFI